MNHNITLRVSQLTGRTSPTVCSAVLEVGGQCSLRGRRIHFTLDEDINIIVSTPRSTGWGRGPTKGHKIPSIAQRHHIQRSNTHLRPHNTHETSKYNRIISHACWCRLNLAPNGTRRLQKHESIPPSFSNPLDPLAGIAGTSLNDDDEEVGQPPPPHPLISLAPCRRQQQLCPYFDRISTCHTIGQHKTEPHA